MLSTPPASKNFQGSHATALKNITPFGVTLFGRESAQLVQKGAKKRSPEGCNVKPSFTLDFTRRSRLGSSRSGRTDLTLTASNVL